jgi:hypothetical protein
VLATAKPNRIWDPGFLSNVIDKICLVSEDYEYQIILVSWALLTARTLQVKLGLRHPDEREGRESSSMSSSFSPMYRTSLSRMLVLFAPN